MDDFAQSLIARIKRVHPGVAVNACGPVIQFGQTAINVDSFRRVAESATDEEMDSYIAKLSEEYFPPEVSFQSVRHRIMPRIYPASLVRDHNVTVVREFGNNCFVCPVIDGDKTIQSADRKHLRNWGISDEQCIDLAIKNLPKSGGMEFRSFVTAEGISVFVHQPIDGYGASRILCNLHRKMHDRLGSTFYAGIPCRDQLWVFPVHHEAVVRRMRRGMQKEFEKRPYPITPELFLVTRDGVAGTEPLVPESGTLPA